MIDGNFIFLRSFTISKSGYPINRIAAMRQRFIQRSDWMSALCYKMKDYFSSVTFVICVENKHKNEKFVKEENIDGINFCVMTLNDFYARVEENCDTLFMRSGMKDYSAPKKVTSIYYGASKSIFPSKTADWNAVVSCMETKDKRVHGWIKGLSLDFWTGPEENKEHDFISFGRGKKDHSIIRDVAKKFPDKSILAVGLNKKHLPQKNIKHIEWEADHSKVRDLMAKSKWAIASACVDGEGFPMSTQLEYSMMGLSYIYSDYVKQDGYYCCPSTAVKISDVVFSQWKYKSVEAREYAMRFFSDEVSAKSLMEVVKKVRKRSHE